MIGVSNMLSLFRCYRIKLNGGGKILDKIKETRSIFIHIPKTGGKSIFKSIYKVDMHDSFGHAGIKAYLSIFSKTTFDKYFKFAFVRNPWDRLYSGYCFAKQGGFDFETDRQLKAAIGDMDFECFVKNWLPKQQIMDDWIIFKPQYTFICGDNNELLIDRFCYFEEMEKEYRYLQNYFNKNIELIHINESKKNKSYLNVYDEEMKKIVEDIYLLDIKLFGYDFFGIKNNLNSGFKK